MCGIVGYTGSRRALDVLLDGLARLEYRGYDSAGVAMSGPGGVEIVRRKGALSQLQQAIASAPPSGESGIGHTRWATHGPPSDSNAHPHTDCSGRIAVVHNGIIENFAEVRAHLEKRGHQLRSDTDTEVIAHLIEEKLGEDGLAHAVREAVAELQGAYAIAVVSADDPDLVVGARMSAPLIVGLGEGESFLASDIPALLGYTRRVLALGDGQVVQIRKGSVEVTDLSGLPVVVEPMEVTWDQAAAERGGFPDFMLKEIHEQPQALRDTLLGRWEHDGVIQLDELRLTEEDIRRIDKVFIVACGSAFHAGLIARHGIEHWSRLAVEVEVASEFRYRDPVLHRNTLVIAVSQSGETLDTLEAVRHARDQKARVIAVTNVVGSSIAREAEAVLYTRAGPEISVAATKTFTTQVAALQTVALFIAQTLGAVYPSESRELLERMEEIPDKVQTCIDRAGDVRVVAEAMADAPLALFLGRNVGFPVALEGALKLKEIAYVHASGYPAGEMKHGPIALLEKGVPVVVVGTRSRVSAKLLSNVQEVKARGATTVLVANDGDEAATSGVDHVLWVPQTHELLSPMLDVIPLQLLAYYVARIRGLDPDRPRNLAKTVTVE
ncbi:MAG TPA: glutamine--fructose-6-phosphate transaminase (isomerizing) [Actinomycetota bacterium]|nr:glutamine--fructose-6-phosphate transaminase (isomerizing) [Actinomycetota bacterium]